MWVANVFQGAAISSPPLERAQGDVGRRTFESRKGIAKAIVKNDLEGIERLVAVDWIIVGPDGEIVERARFFEVIKSGAMTHDTMESEDFRIRVYGEPPMFLLIAMGDGNAC
jgi:hypothetical protein